MKIEAISHIAVGVTDMQRSLGFYRDVLGLHVSLDTEEELPAFGGAPVQRRHAVYLRWQEGPHETFIVLDQQLLREPFGSPPELFQTGTHHWGLWVDDVDAIVARAEAASVPIMVRPADADSIAYGEPAGKVLRSAFLRDPDGNIVQLDQRT
jgi:catechol 2,3-dioxygenase-like lactoylglutathione lyase family enzyme